MGRVCFWNVRPVPPQELSRHTAPHLLSSRTHLVKRLDCQSSEASSILVGGTVSRASAGFTITTPRVIWATVAQLAVNQPPLRYGGSNPSSPTGC